MKVYYLKNKELKIYYHFFIKEHVIQEPSFI